MPIEEASKVMVKLFARPGAPAAAELIPVFHRWITEQKLEELVIDVADYSHVHEGPGVILIGHEGDYYYDFGEGRPGLLYSQKRDAEDAELDFAGRLKLALSRAKIAEGLLSEDGLSFEGNEVLIRIPDRLHVKNDEASFEAAQPIVAQVLKEAFGDQVAVNLSQEGDVREPLTLRAKFSPLN